MRQELVAILPANLQVPQLLNVRQDGLQSAFDRIIEGDLELLATFDCYAVSCPLQFFAADTYHV
jgi:hypothetical protein